MLPKFLLILAFALSGSYPGWSQTTYNPADASKKLFEQYKPVIERKEQAVVDEPKAITGDLNGDGLADCILYFVLTPKDGGNMIVDRQAAVYLNTGHGMKVAGAFPDLGCYVVDRVAGGIIYVSMYECAPPYSTKTGSRRYRWNGGKLTSIK